MPNVAFEYWQPDEVAECIEGIPRDLYAKLWSFVEDYTDGVKTEDNPLGIDYPGEISERNKMPLFWDRLSADEQATLLRLERQTFPEG